MTQLIVRVIDPGMQGSHGQYKRLRRLVRMYKEAQKSGDADAQMDVQDQAEALIVPQLATDDGMPVVEALDELSELEFWDLFDAVMAKKEEPAQGKSEQSDSGPPDEA